MESRRWDLTINLRQTARPYSLLEGGGHVVQMLLSENNEVIQKKKESKVRQNHSSKFS